MEIVVCVYFVVVDCVFVMYVFFDEGMVGFVFDCYVIGGLYYVDGVLG